MARVLVGVNLAALLGVLFATAQPANALEMFVRVAGYLEPLLLAVLLVLALASPWLADLSYRKGFVAVVALVCAMTLAYHVALFKLSSEPPPSLLRSLLLAALLTAALLGYLHLRAKAHSPALVEARLQALQARIRPHFLFNSLNAVLSLIRRDPKRAERALEDLADLFRTLMAEPRQFVKLADEIALLRRYAGLEELRLGERLRIVWELETAPAEALLPPLVLQPLLENAVFHGVEPGTEPGEVLVRIERRDDRVLARIENPWVEEQPTRVGNRMALDNIRERLALFFDAEARITSGRNGARYRVEIEMPYLAERA